ncbi:PP2C family protein-serine/threonine phosphatase [Reichenbachiella agarivorans]|uniref:PP2C family protein-serine/threonine phosphatase n=1 Tax=Reichenbachiella agarivorans TaxID=2979464 RepID=A0ABY6CL87_9BACT|nr:PP2C family protein-serine/threonine phosphatase [Reichenbachiella agarivorans]UXP30850.1 PP2C family protein-serine/threonine phosphatase [Reichenbachiella agarivorans]
MNTEELIASNLKELELNSLLEVTEAINNNLPEESLYKIYHFTLLANLKIKKLALFVLEDLWESKVCFGVKQEICDQISLEAFESLTKTTAIDRNLPESEYFEYAIPVLHKERILALVFIADVTQSKMGISGKSPTTFLEAITNILIVAIENKKLARKQLEQEALTRELEIATQVQKNLFPKQLPNTDVLEIDAVYQPHHNVGGDYYDYVQIHEDVFMVCIADVSGKGIPAALMMSNFQASLRTLIRQTDDLEKIVRELNYQLVNTGNADIFITFFVAFYNHKSKELSYANCGHNPPLMTSRKGEVIELSKGTTVLGMFEPLPFIETGHLHDIDSFDLFCYTDGLTEAENQSEEEFGESRVEKLVKAYAKSSASNLNKKILADVERFRDGKPYRDDITLVAVKLKSNP